MNEDIQDDIELLNLMLKDYNNQEFLYKPGPYWENYSARITKAIKYYGLKNFKSNSLILNGYDEAIPISPFDLVPTSPLKHMIRKIAQNPILSKFFHYPYDLKTIIKYSDHLFNQIVNYKSKYYNNILNDWYSKFLNKYSLPNTLAGKPHIINTILLNNNKIGAEYLTAFIDIHNYSKVVNFDKIKTVFEIGGGYGAFAHSLLTIFPNIKKYIYLDIPPILYVGTQYLKYFFGKNVKDYRQTSKYKKIHFSSDDKIEIIALCPWQIEMVEAEVDFFWNSYSFQEMTRDILVNYLNYIQYFLKNYNSKIGLRMYTNDSSRSLSLKDIEKIFQKNTFFHLDELKADINIKNDKYYFGYLKNTLKS